MSSKSKDRGGAFERAICKKLAKWSGKEFRKSPASGALRWKNTFWTFGDIVPPEDFPFVVEAKTRDDIHFEAMLSPKYDPDATHDHNFCGWWYRQAVADAERASAQLEIPLEPMLIWKRTGTSSRICLDAETYFKLPGDSRARMNCFWIGIPGKRPFVVTDFDGFLAAVSYDDALRVVT